jgi:hypothetical protein
MCEEQSLGVAASQARGVHYYALISFALQVLTMSASLVPRRPNEVDILPFLTYNIPRHLSILARSLVGCPTPISLGHSLYELPLG